MGQKYFPIEKAQLGWPIKLGSSNPPDELHLKCRAGRIQYTFLTISLYTDPI